MLKVGHTLRNTIWTDSSTMKHTFTSTLCRRYSTLYTRACYDNFCKHSIPQLFTEFNPTVQKYSILENGSFWNRTRTCTNFSRCIAIGAKKLTITDTEEIIDELLDEHWEQFSVFVELFRCSYKDMEGLVLRDHRILTTFNFSQIERKVKLLLKHGFQKVQMLHNATWLYGDYEMFEERCNQLEPARKYGRYGVNVLTMTDKSFRVKLKKLLDDAKILESYSDRDSGVASILKCDVEKLHDLAKQGHKHLLTKYVKDIKQIVDEFAKRGIAEDVLVNNIPKVFYYSAKHVHHRLEVANKYGVKNPQNLLSLIQNTVVDLDIKGKRHGDEEKIFAKYGGTLNFLKARLNIHTEEELQAVIKAAPCLKNIKASRLIGLLNLLLNECKFSKTEIKNFARIFSHSEEKLRQRYLELKEASTLARELEDYPLELLRLMILPQRKYNSLFM